MIDKPTYFDLEELVCPHIFYRYGEMAWQFPDIRQLILVDWLREKVNKPVFINNWYEKFRDSDFIRYIKERMEAKLPLVHADIPEEPKGTFYSQRGLRCNLCSLVYEKTQAGILYASGHVLGKADDFDIQGMVAEESRQYIIKNKNSLPYNIRLEKDVSWVHMDCEDTGQRVTLF